MRAVLSLFLSALLLATNYAYAQTDEIPYQIDEQATAQAPWKVGDIVAEGEVDLGIAGTIKLYRKFMGITNKHYFIVQDFFKKNSKKYSSLFTITQQDYIINIAESYITQSFDGTLTQWYEDGQKRSELHYQDGEAQGLQTHWYSNGKKALEVEIKDQKLNGTWAWWYDNGQKNEEIQYQNGKKQGTSTKWNEEGKKISETVYENGEVVSAKTFD